MNRLRYLLAALGLVAALVIPVSAFAAPNMSTTLTVTIPGTVSISGYGATSYSATGAAGVATTFSTGVQTVTGNDAFGYTVQTDAATATWVGTPGGSFTLLAGTTTFNASACSASITTCAASTPLTTAMQTIVQKTTPAGSDNFTANYTVTPPAGQQSGSYTLTVNEVLIAG